MPQVSLLNYVVRTPAASKATLSNDRVSMKKEALENDEKHISLLTSSSDSTLATDDTAYTIESKLHNKEQRLSLLATVSQLALPHAYISPVDHQHLPALKRLTTTLLPVRYQDVFYTETLETTVSHLCRVIVYQSEPVGWIRCRLESIESGTNSPKAALDETKKIYIQALCLLAPYRGYGLATALLDAVVASQRLHEVNAGSIYAHVWENNNDALEWYEKRGFSRQLLLEQYYRRLKPPGAWIVRKELT